jgi:hypothetical protein
MGDVCAWNSYEHELSARTSYLAIVLCSWLSGALYVGVWFFLCVAPSSLLPHVNGTLGSASTVKSHVSNPHSLFQVYINSDNSHSHHYISTSGPLTKITQRSLNHYTHTQKLVANRHSFPIMAPNDASTQTPSQGHYEVLGLDPACSAAEIKQAHAKIAIDNHPQRIHILTLTNEGKAAADARLLAANAAKEVLLDQEQRDKYDKQLGYDKLRF